LDSLEHTPFLILQVSYDLFWPSLLCQAPLTPPPRPFAVARIRRQEVIITELVIHAEPNSYKRGAHKEKDLVRGREKHVKKTKKDQDTTLKHYVLYMETAMLG
jgi:hypothetical protein